MNSGRGVASKRWSLKAGGCLIHVVSNTGLIVVRKNTFSDDKNAEIT